MQAHWNADLQTLKGHSGPVTAVAFSPDSKQVMSGSIDKTVRLCDVATGALLQTLKGHSSPVTAVAFSPGSRQVVSGSSDNTVRLWEAAIEAPEPLQMLNKDSNWVIAVTFSPDGKQVMSKSFDNIVQLWDASSGVLLQTLDTGDSGLVAFSPNSKSLPTLLVSDD